MNENKQDWKDRLYNIWTKLGIETDWHMDTGGQISMELFISAEIAAAEKRGYNTAMAEVKQAEPSILADEFQRGADKERERAKPILEVTAGLVDALEGSVRIAMMHANASDTADAQKILSRLAEYRAALKAYEEGR